MEVVENVGFVALRPLSWMGILDGFPAARGKGISVSERAAMAQITAYFAVAEREALAAYASNFGLDASELATLLLFRELRVARLGRLKEAYDCASHSSSGRKLTVRASVATKGILSAHAAQFGLRLPIALLVLCRAEMAEHWLDRAIQLDSTGVGE